jgi:hypothetical protein
LRETLPHELFIALEDAAKHKMVNEKTKQKSALIAKYEVLTGSSSSDINEKAVINLSDR